MKNALIACVALCVLGVLPATGTESESVKSPSQFELFGLWGGAINMEGHELNALDRRIQVEITRDGNFYCFTHDLINGSPQAVSKGKWAQREKEVTLISHLPDGEVKTTYEYRLVMREERSPTTPPQLYLHDYERGIHIRLEWKGPLSER